ncbi:ciliary microtubule inner protein 1 [Pelodytes ibericus]
MAATQSSKATGKQDNFVAQDRIWKDHIKTEIETAKKWPESWGYLTTFHDELMKNDTEGMKEMTRLKTPEHMQIRPVTPLDTYIKVGPSPSVPQTTQGLVGWRSAIPELQLERYGRSRFLKGDFCKHMNWPPEGVS